MNDYKNGIEGLQQLLKIRKGDPEITKELVNVSTSHLQCAHLQRDRVVVIFQQKKDFI